MARKTSKIFAECRQNFSPWVLHNKCTRGGGRWILMKSGNVNSTDGKKCHPQLARCTIKKGAFFQVYVVKKFPYLRRSGDEEMTGKIPASWENSEQGNRKRKSWKVKCRAFFKYFLLCWSTALYFNLFLKYMSMYKVALFQKIASGSGIFIKIFWPNCRGGGDEGECLYGLISDRKIIEWKSCSWPLRW